MHSKWFALCLNIFRSICSHTPHTWVLLSFQEHTDVGCVCLFSWCGPCKILGPRLEKAVAKQKGRVAMAKVDIDDHTDLAIEYGVRRTAFGLPSKLWVLLFVYDEVCSDSSWGIACFIVMILHLTSCNLVSLQVSAVPTVIAMRGGDVVDHFVGIKDDDELDSFVSKVIGQ